jgi:nucleotide-binding universal stress UspA family protein
LLAIDNSETALYAAKVAGDLARAVNPRELHIVIAYEPVPNYSGESNLYSANLNEQDKSQDILQETEKALGSVPAEIRSELIEGHITETVISVAKNRHSDLIIMGSEGMGRLTGALVGINGQKVVSEAPCPVLIVR